MSKEQATYYSSPIGMIKIQGTDSGISQLHFVEKPGKSDAKVPAIVKTCVKQLDEYFAGKRKGFDLDLAIDGTDFQKKVWQALKKIPYGKTFSYGKIASIVKKPKASRAVGLANNKNKISIILPCHRVIGSDGSLTGYGGGLWRKEWLLEHEKNHC